MIKGIAFDKDGTLLRYEEFWMPVSESAIEKIVAGQNIKGDFTDILLKALGIEDGIAGLFYSGTYGEFAEVFNKTMGEMGYALNVTANEVSNAFSQSFSAGKLLPVCDNIQEVFKSLKNMGIKTAVITTDNSDITKRCLEILGIYEYIDILYTDDGVNPSKPNPYYMNCFCEKYGFEKTDVLMVGDTMTDMSFANNSGVTAVGVASQESNKKILRQKADYVIDDISHIFEVIEDVRK